jgi:hypothetical protein
VAVGRAQLLQLMVTKQRKEDRSRKKQDMENIGTGKSKVVVASNWSCCVMYGVLGTTILAT